MTQREIDAAQDELDAEEATKRCKTCGQKLPEPVTTHVYAVKLQLGSGYFKWHYSLPCTKAEAERNARDLKATGHDVLSMTVADGLTHKAKFGERRFRK